jgi:cellulase
MDIWEANKMATSIAPHTCNHTSLYKCTGPECSFNGTCDQWGCSYNPYGLGNHDYYGPGLKVDTNRRFTVITQFPAENGTLKAINRLYIQDGKIIQNAAVNFTGKAVNASITNEFCTGRGGHFMDLGGVGGMGDALSRGMVLVFSVWWAGSGAMNWLDSGSAGPCNATEGDPSIIRGVEKDPAVTFSMIKWGDIGSTFSAK